MKLLEWASTHLRHQDLLKRSIESIQEEQQTLIITHKDKTKDIWLVQEDLDLSNTQVKGIITLNTKNNLKKLIKEWSIVKEADCKIFFANPQTNDRWAIVPSHHTKIADQKNIKAGLESLAQNTTFVKTS